MKPADSILTFALVPLRIRIINAVIALCIAAACLQVYSESLQVPVIGLILLCISIGAAGLIDCWQFAWGFYFPYTKSNTVLMSLKEQERNVLQKASALFNMRSVFCILKTVVKRRLQFFLLHAILSY